LISDFHKDHQHGYVEIMTEEIIVEPSFTDKVVDGIVNLNSPDTIEVQVDEFMSAVTPIEPDSE